jgi:hypothetical protein
MLDDLVDYRATVLLWSALGGGSISLPYLEQEAFGEVPPRYRLYGFVNDTEFIAACHQRGIKVFGVVFECQGWEFPVELNENEDSILALNELRGWGKRSWLGLREFSLNLHPRLWRSFEHYFPHGLVNSDGQPVRDLLEEGAARDIHGAPCHARWVECPDRDHYCYHMDRNNPVWREYLKAIIRIQIDAGVDGIQLDEADLPITSIQYGGCFCKDCMRQFRDYLRGLPTKDLPNDLLATDLTKFHYGEWLLEQGYDFKSRWEATPLFGLYLRFQHRAVTRYFAELVDYAREYAASTGRQILVSGNFLELAPHFYAMESKVDLLVTEMRNTGYRQPTWCRYCAGFAGRKPVLAVENPYGGVVPELVTKLQVGRGFDLFRIMTYEASALGINMSIPYGAWMGSAIEDAFYAPHDVAVEVQSFISSHEALFTKSTLAETAIVFSTLSEFEHERRKPGDTRATPFWLASEALIQARQPYDVVMFSDGALREDSIELAHLTKYRTIILPNCEFLTPHQAELVASFQEAGGQVIATGPLATNLTHHRGLNLLQPTRSRTLRQPTDFSPSDLVVGAQLHFDRPVDCAVNVFDLESGAAIHIIRYDYDEGIDAVPVLPELSMRIRLVPGLELTDWFGASAVGFRVSLRSNDAGDYVLALANVPLYTIIVFKPTLSEISGADDLDVC